jgi:integrase
MEEKGGVTIYKRGDTWGISYFYNGKRIRKAIGTKKKAEAELEAIRTDIRGGRYKEPRRDSFDDLAKQYEAIKKDKKGYASEKTYIKRVREFCAPWKRGFGNRKSSGFDGGTSGTGRYTSLATGPKTARIGRSPYRRELAEELGRLKRLREASPLVLATDLVFAPPRRRTARRKGHLEVITGPMVDIRNAWETAKKKAGIPAGFHFHDLRHTTASWLKMAGVDDYTVMEILGHSDHKMMRRYAYLTPQHKREALARLPGWGSKKTWHKSGTSQREEEKRDAAESPQPLVFAGAEEGS